MAMSICGSPSSLGFALETFTVQRASRSFWRSVEGGGKVGQWSGANSVL
jgi:hypothetical protein